MIEISIERLIQWARFLAIGVVIYFIVSIVVKRYLQGYNVKRTLYFDISYIITPTTFLIIIPTDLFFLFYGQNLVYMRVPLLLESIILTIGSFFYTYVGMEGILAIIYHPLKKYYIHTILLTILSAIGSSVTIILGLLSHRIIEFLPVASIFLALGLSATQINRRYNPLKAIVLHLATIILSVTYVLFFLQIYS